MTRVKVCGLMNRKDVNSCVQAGVHMVGFVVNYPIPVPWNLTSGQARELIQQVPPFVSTCVVTGGSVEKILSTAMENYPDVIQLHYKETLEEVHEISCLLKQRGIKTIKALCIDDKGNCDFEISDPAMAARELAKAGVSAILVDSITSSRPGGTGVAVDLSAFRAVQRESSLPVILAGGLNPMNVLNIIRKTRPYAVDVLTGVEEKPGSKDRQKIFEFMRRVQSLR